MYEFQRRHLTTGLDSAALHSATFTQLPEGPHDHRSCFDSAHFCDLRTNSRRAHDHGSCLARNTFRCAYMATGFIVSASFIWNSRQRERPLRGSRTVGGRRADRSKLASRFLAPPRVLITSCDSSGEAVHPKLVSTIASRAWFLFLSVCLRLAAYEVPERLHDHRSCLGSITLRSACRATGTFTSISVMWIMR